MEISHIASAARRVFPASVPNATPTNPAAAPSDEDKVELSNRALLLSRLRELPDVRADLVQRVRDAIEAGEYDSPDKIDAALDRLIEEHGAGLDLEA